MTTEPNELQNACERLRKIRAADEVSHEAYLRAVVEAYGAGDLYGAIAADEGLVIDAYLAEHAEQPS